VHKIKVLVITFATNQLVTHNFIQFHNLWVGNWKFWFVVEHAIPKRAIFGMYLPCRNCLVFPWFAFGSAIGHNLTIFGSIYHFRTSEHLSEFSNLP